MTTMVEGAVSRAELNMMLRSAAALGSPAEQGRQRARRISNVTVTGLASLAGVISAYDVALVLQSV